MFKKGGADLATDSVPILNPLTIQACFFIPTVDQWRKEIIDLNNYANQQSAVIKFNYISNQGGSINIDNINFGNSLSIAGNDKINNLKVYPNPARDIITFETTSDEDFQLTIFNSLGQSVLQQHCTSRQNTINTVTFQSGIYYYKMVSNNGEIVSGKFVKE